MKELLFALWFLWPAGVATLIPVLAAITPGLKRFDQPIDGGRQFRGRRLLGANKTWRGLVTATLLGTLWFVVQVYLYEQSSFIRSFSEFNYTQLSIWIGVGLSAGAIIGDAVGSFAKRQLDIAPGKAWFPYDQLDFIVGGLVLSLPFILLPWGYYLLMPAVWLVVHLTFGYLGYLLHLQKDPI